MFFSVDPGADVSLHEELSILEYDFESGFDFPFAPIVNPGIGVLFQGSEPTGPNSIRIYEKSLLFESVNLQDEYEARLRVTLSRPFDTLASSPLPTISLLDGTRQALRSTPARIEQFPNANDPYVDIIGSFSADDIEGLLHQGVFFGTSFIARDNLFVRGIEILLSSPGNAGSIRILGEAIPEPSSVVLLTLAIGSVFCQRKDRPNSIRDFNFGGFAFRPTASGEGNLGSWSITLTTPAFWLSRLRIGSVLATHEAAS